MNVFVDCFLLFYFTFRFVWVGKVFLASGRGSSPLGLLTCPHSDPGPRTCYRPSSLPPHAPHMAEDQVRPLAFGKLQRDTNQSFFFFFFIHYVFLKSASILSKIWISKNNKILLIYILRFLESKLLIEIKNCHLKVTLKNMLKII